MAKGISNRTALSMSSADPDAQKRELQRWANGLPFGSTGFHVYASVNQGPFANATSVSVNFDKTLAIKVNDPLDHEGWKIVGTANSFKVPRGLSGIYVMNFGGYHVNKVEMYASITINGKAISGVVPYGVLSVTTSSFATYPLYEGDILRVNYYNASGVNQTITALGPAGVVDPQMPYFSAWRISLL